MNTPNNNAENKILILYALVKAKYSMTKHDLSLIMLDNLLMNYYNFSDSLYGLKDGRFIINDKMGNDEYIEITESGIKMLELFLPNQDQHKLSMIDTYLNEMKDKLIEKNSVRASYEVIDKDRYFVHLMLKEGKKILLEVNAELPDEEAAKEAVSNWEKNPDKVYLEILKIIK